MQGIVSDKQIPALSRQQAARTPWLVFLISLIVTLIAWHYSNLYLAIHANERFAFRSQQVVEAVSKRMHDYEQVLRGGVGLWLVSPDVSREQWHTYVDNAQLAINYPGIQNMAVSFPIRAEEKAAHIARVRAEGFSEFDIRPNLPQRPLYHSLTYVEPFSDRNLRAFGFDMYTNPVRRAAMDKAIEQGKPAISGMVKLAQETQEDVQFGFIYCLPVYKAGMPLTTASERHAALRVLVSGGFRANDLMKGIFGDNTKDVELEIFDDAVISKDTRLYSSFKQAEAPTTQFISHLPIEFGERKWLLRISGNQQFISSVSSVQSNVVLASGILLSLALFATLTSLASRERRARLLAAEMTQDLFDKESHFSRIISSSSEAIVSMTPNGQITSWNPAATKIFGYTEAAALQLPVQALLHNDQAQEGYSLLQQLADGTHFQHFETRYQHQDGYWVDVAVSPSLQYDAAGQLLGATLIMRDISERKHAKKQLFDLQYQMLQWVEELPIGLFVLNQQGKTHYANRRAVSILGRGVARDAGPEDLAQAYQVYREGTDELYPTEEIPVVQALAGKVCMMDDIEIALESGRRKLQVWGQPVYSADGKVEFGVAAFEDITERKQALEVQALYADIVASSHDAIMSFKLDGTITAWNPAAQQMFGYEMASILGQNSVVLVPAERHVEEPMLMARLVRGEYIEQFETIRLREDGSTLDVAINFSPMRNSAGQIIGASAVMSNISQRKQIDKLKSEFVSTVSHELRTPLTSIRGSLGLVLGGAAGHVPERCHSLLTIASNNCERLVRLINDILDIEKLESGKFHFDLKRSDLSYLVEQVMINNQAYAQQLGVSFVLLDPPGSIFVHVDADRIAQVLANLLSNAAKFSPQGQQIEISISRPTLGEVKVAVQDHGYGIPDAFKARIFQKFAQADSSDTRKMQRGGTGLGLSIAKAIIEQHGGYIGFNSVEGEGTCFYFILKEEHALDNVDQADRVDIVGSVEKP